MARHPSLDWLRVGLIVCSVIGHILTCGTPDMLQSSAVDEWDTQGGTWWVRSMSACRPYCIPLLFFISGYALALKQENGWRAAKASSAITGIGVLVNSALWELSPKDPACGPRTPCPSSPSVFAFTFCPNTGKVFPRVFQFWFTIVLTAHLLCSMPLIVAIRGVHASAEGRRTWKSGALLGLLTPLLTTLTAAAPNLLSMSTIVIVAHLETIASGAALLSAIMPGAARAMMYVVGAVAVAEASLKFPGMQVHGALSGEAGGAFPIYAFLLFHKFFVLGWLACTERYTHSRGSSALVSRCWAVAILLFFAGRQSSNWNMHGHLTFPYFGDALRRGAYTAPIVFAALALDRLDRLLATSPQLQCPVFLRATGHYLYLTHSIAMTLWWSARPNAGVLETLAASILVALSFAALEFTWVTRQSVKHE